MIEVESGIKAPIVGEVQQAIRWLKENGIHAYEDDGVYIEVGGEYEIQISSSEVSYRAELYREEK